MSDKVERFYDSGRLDFMEQLILEDPKMRRWMAEGRIGVLGMLGYELKPDDINSRY